MTRLAAEGIRNRETLCQVQRHRAEKGRMYAGYAHILHMSDVLSDGIIKQFPQKF